MNSAVIFAGGKSSRMGQDKALLPFGNCQSMSEFQYIKLKKIFKQVYLSAKEEKFDFDAAVIKDLYTQSSPMVALASLFLQLEEEAFFVLSVDMPYIGKNEIEPLLHHYRHSVTKPDIVIAQSPRGIEPLCGIYHRSILPHVKALLEEDNHRMRALLERVATETVLFEDSTDFTNLNTPQEYQAIHP